MSCRRPGLPLRVNEVGLHIVASAGTVWHHLTLDKQNIYRYDNVTITTMHESCSTPGDGPFHRPCPSHPQPKVLSAPSPVSTEHCNYVRSCSHRIDCLGLRILLHPLRRRPLTSCKTCSAYISAAPRSLGFARLQRALPQECVSIKAGMRNCARL